MDKVEQRARELLASECPECGGRNGYDVPDGDGSGRWQNCGTCRDDERLHSVNRYQALRAIVAALSQQPEARGVVKRPTDAEIEAVARVIMEADGFAFGEGKTIKASKQGGNPRAARWWKVARKAIAALTGERNVR